MSKPFSIGSDVWPGLSKVIEEAGELQQVAGKLIGSGGDLRHWDGTDLKERLLEELSDTLAACEFFIQKNNFSRRAISIRTESKLKKYERWHTEGKFGKRRTGKK